MVLKAAKRKTKERKKRLARLSHHLSTASARKKIAIVLSLFNEEICTQLKEGALCALRDNGYVANDVAVFEVAGAFEIPFLSQQVARTGLYAGVVALGCVIRGDTPHFEYVCRAVTDGCLRVGLDTGCPVAFGVITVNNLEQARERAQQNDCNKGKEAVLALIDTLSTLETLSWVSDARQENSL
ncbi:MAG: hypothetical protein ACD_62C00395G0015 [uncultured bacterium]|nr:MAG: hypothetical protein ACD_62C00395G0015 [uncultured bacterium]